MKCRQNKNCPLRDPKNLMILGACAAAALMAAGAAIATLVARRRRKAQMQPILFPAAPVNPPVEEAEEDPVLETEKE